ncbi:unnamed protein product [Ceutorhynchus assimilis]|uniref:P-type domain-containing protein n=1 Tax=Ceutorhynchus assimilis TaxID=467358 RepID=A0A9N9MXY4_9CUCU|nr:unnamed protein product [Ceutorhynchus assimilis]
MTSFIEKELEDFVDPDEEPHFVRKTTWKTIICTKLARGLIIVLFLAIVVPTLAYLFVISRNVPSVDEQEDYYCLIREEYRVPCGKIGITSYECEKINCCFDTTTGKCHHFLPSKYFYRPDPGSDSYQTSQASSPVGSKALQNLKLTIQNKTSNRLSLIIHEPSEIVKPISTSDPNYSITQASKKLIVEVFDKDGDAIFTSAKGALIASEKYWEWSFQLSNDTLFGLDRNLIKLNADQNLTKVIYKNRDDHSTLPVFWAYQNGKFHGAVIKHDGPLEIEVLSSYTVILRSLLGKKIEVELSLGPTPADLYRDQTVDDIVVPPLWFLGTHNCRKGESTTLSDLLKIYSANNSSNLDTDCIHENLFVTLQNKTQSQDDVDLLKTYVVDMFANGKKFMFCLPPQILIHENNELYIKAKELGILYKNENGSIYEGSYLNQPVVYPDYSANSSEYMETLIKWIDTHLGMDYISGFILNDNWPEDESFIKVPSSSFPYYTQEINNQMLYTLPWYLKGHNQVAHYESHNLYGQYQDDALSRVLPASQSLIIASTKTYGNTEPVISDNFDTSWENFKLYLNRILFGSITGNQMVGLPICGDTDNYNKTLHQVLCLRWYIAAASMPYFRVISGDVFRDPANLNSQYATQAVEASIKRRALLQDYFYTIMNKNEPLVRPMYYDYFNNTETFSLERQYTIGKDLMVAHPLSSGRIVLQVYLPPERGVWYEFWGGTIFKPLQKNRYYMDIETFETDWTMLVAQGTIVALTTSTDIQLYIALDCSMESNCTASGDLLKDGNNFTFLATNSSVTIKNIPASCGYFVTFLKVYNYTDSSLYSKNAELCKEGHGDSLAINYSEDT